AHSDQVREQYLPLYGQVLVTNYWSFVLVGRDERGQPALLESFQLAEDEAAFWQVAAQPQRLAQERGEQLLEYLKRVMLRPTTVSRPRDVAWFLASYARDALARITAARITAAGDGALPGLANIREALQETLGVHFEGDEGDRFFRSTMIQTLFYGIFSAWVLWHNQNPVRKDRFDWRVAAYELHVPVIQVLFEQLAAPSRLRALNLVEVLEWVGDVLNRVDRGEFFSHFEEGQAVQYFYEPFLEAFSPELRKELGVWYTPREVVKYMVERVDTVLRQELGIADGLADDNVYVLDPAAGTGAYLVEVLHKIAETERAKGNEALAAARVKAAAQERVFGFELLPAPFVISHLQLGLLLRNLGAPLTGDQRAGVYLTNSLTGWAEGEQQALPIPEFAQEREAAQTVKQERPILVVLGNPPYNSFAGVAIGEERDLSDAYRQTKRAPKPQGHGLNDLYVRFYRMAERAIVEMQPRHGVVCFISNYSWLDGRSFSGMRERYLEVFDHIWIDRLNGDKYKTGKVTPDGKPDPSIFSTEWNREGIQVGTAIALLLRAEEHSETEGLYFRDLWGVTKRSQLLATAKQEDNRLYHKVEPVVELGLAFPPVDLESNYLEWPQLTDILPVYFPGVTTARDSVLVDTDREWLVERMRKYFDPTVSHEEMRTIAPRLLENASRFDAVPIREYLQERGFLPENIVRFCYRPFDVRWLYWEPETKLLDEKRSEYFPHVFEGNVWIEARQRQAKENFDRGYVVTVFADNFGSGRSSFFPLYLLPNDPTMPLLARGRLTQPEPNVSREARRYLATQKVSPPKLFYHVAAVLNTPSYRSENTGALRQDWPRVPLPKSAERLQASADLGEQVAALLNPEEAVPGVTTGAIRPELR
ncbi:MAG: type ISP restriction/modification enzyme, partial [Chloroflexota bacterium]